MGPKSLNVRRINQRSVT